MSESAETKIKIIQWVDVLRENFGFSKQEVCEKMDVNPSHYSNWLQRGLPISRLEKLAALFGEHPNKILAATQSDNYIFYSNAKPLDWLHHNHQESPSIITHDHKTWLMAVFNIEKKTAHIATHEFTVNNIQHWLNHAISPTLIVINESSFRKLQTKTATSHEIFNAVDHQGWAYKKETIKTGSLYFMPPANPVLANRKEIEAAFLETLNDLIMLDWLSTTPKTNQETMQASAKMYFDQLAKKLDL